MEGHFFLQDVRQTYFCVLQFFQNNLICCHCQQCYCFWRHISPLTKCHYQGDPPRSYVTSHENRQTCNLISDMFLWATMSLTRRQQWKWPRRHSQSSTNQPIFNHTQQNDTSHWSEMTLLPSMIWSSPIAILVNSIFASFHLFIIYTFTFLYLYTFILLKSFWYFCQFRHCRYFTLFENISMYLKDNISASLWLVVDWLPSQMICGTF